MPCIGQIYENTDFRFATTDALKLFMEHCRALQSPIAILFPLVSHVFAIQNCIFAIDILQNAA